MAEDFAEFVEWKKARYAERVARTQSARTSEGAPLIERCCLLLLLLRQLTNAHSVQLERQPERWARQQKWRPLSVLRCWPISDLCVQCSSARCPFGALLQATTHCDSEGSSHRDIVA